MAVLLVFLGSLVGLKLPGLFSGGEEEEVEVKVGMGLLDTACTWVRLVGVLGLTTWV